jgi:hypothetical protein
LDTSHHLGDKNKINDQWRSKKRILANIEETELVRTAVNAVEGMKLTK